MAGFGLGYPGIEAEQRAQPLRLDGDAGKHLGFRQHTMNQGRDDRHDTGGLQQDVMHRLLHTVVYD